MRRSCAWAIFVFVCALILASRAAATPRYDGSSNEAPHSATWDWGYLPLNLDLPIIVPAQATAVAAGGVTTLDTTPATADGAGWTTFIPAPFSFSHPDLVPLDSSVGFGAEFGVRLLSESHLTNDRAGFNVILLDTNSVGIEIAFWEDAIWAQNVDFTHGESVALDTTASLLDYRLEILGGSYTLFVNDIEVLDGALRDYTGFFVYDTPNYTFFGDNTSSAAAEVEISYFRVVPEPSSIVLALLGGLALVTVRRRTLATR